MHITRDLFSDTLNHKNHYLGPNEDKNINEIVRFLTPYQRGGYVCYINNSREGPCAIVNNSKDI